MQTLKYTPRHFIAQELVSPYVFQRLGDAALTVMDDRVLIALDAIRDYLGAPITVNNWHTGGAFDQRGYRDDSAAGAKLSQHRMGRAVDFDVHGMDAESVRRKIMALWPFDDRLQHITRMEAGVRWTHIDVCPITVSKPVLFNP